MRPRRRCFVGKTGFDTRSPLDVISKICALTATECVYCRDRGIGGVPQMAETLGVGGDDKDALRS